MTTLAYAPSEPRIAPPAKKSASRLVVLDGWRACSILLVLACHMLPLGPSKWDLNVQAGMLGMALFFFLSGFLITTTLLENPDWRSFGIRRACRILPLAYVWMFLCLVFSGAALPAYGAHLLFYSNYQPDLLLPVTSPTWSLCLEVQFYIFVMLLVAFFGRRGLLALPVACLAVTVSRVILGNTGGLATHARVDEILVGTVVALLHHEPRAAKLRYFLGRVPLPLFVLVLLGGCNAHFPVLNYLRPYAAACVVASTLWRERPMLNGILSSRVMRYIATISYALYVIHPIMRVSYFDTSSKYVKYLVMRPIGFALTFALAHLSTFYFESRWIAIGKRFTRRHVAVETAPAAKPAEAESASAPVPAAASAS